MPWEFFCTDHVWDAEAAPQQSSLKNAGLQILRPWSASQQSGQVRRRAGLPNPFTAVQWLEFFCSCCLLLQDELPQSSFFPGTTGWSVWS